MASLPDPTVDAIYASYEKHEAAKPPRQGRLGGSRIGEDCRRMLYYEFRRIRRQSVGGRILRLFETGHREESRIVQNLRDIGINVLDVDPNTKNQWAFTGGGDHLIVRLDGVLLGLLEAPKTWHLLECKTSNRKNFLHLQKNGCEKSKPVHWAQIQLGMGLAGLTRAVYIVQNKDTDELYLERVHFDRKQFEALLRKANTIIYAESPPERIGKDPSFYKCKFCNFANYCFGKEWPDVSCRTCAHGTPVLDGKWSCARGFECITCDEHVFLPSLIHWAEPIDGNETHIRYKVDDYEFVNCAASGFSGTDSDHYSSKDLCTA